MALYSAKKLVIITEKLISKPVCEIIEGCGATGYTIVMAGGKSNHLMRTTTDRASVVHELTNVKIEVIVGDKAMAQEIVERVNEAFFKNYSGITYLEDVEILRPEKFDTLDDSEGS